MSKLNDLLFYNIHVKYSFIDTMNTYMYPEQYVNKSMEFIPIEEFKITLMFVSLTLIKDI